MIKKMFTKIKNSISLKIKDKIDKNNNSKISYSWMWEFSKKVVFAIFIIYIVNYILCWTASFLCGYYNWNIPYIDTFVNSTNETTQIVLGGYLIKAMAENVIKVKNKKLDTSNIENDEVSSEETDDYSSF